jgi:4-hydroxy-3-methylbut-2-en-1-yl diphosphate reductase
MTKAPLKILLAAPRGFCAGVDRAIQIVKLALQRYGTPVYVRHEIVHNRYVVESLETLGAVFVEELDEVPEDAIVIFSAHGVAKAVPAEAERRHLQYIDATCPLVSKVHREAERHFSLDHHIILIGHAGHPEVVGTIGQLPQGAITLVESAEDVAALEVEDPSNLAYITQTTLSVDETVSIVGALQERFPDIAGPKKEDICYATTNRQAAVKQIANRCELFLAIGAPNSSNSLRLVEVARQAGCDQAMLVQRARDLDWGLIDAVHTIGISAGASAPELLVEEVIAALRQRREIEIEEVTVAVEDVEFKLPRELRVPAA